MLLKFIAQQGIAQLWEAATSRPCCYQHEETNKRCGFYTRYHIRCDRSAGDGAPLCAEHLPDWAKKVATSDNGDNHAGSY
jgi:hypothetical protein